MPHFTDWLNNGLKPIARLLSTKWWRNRFRALCTANTPYDDDFETFESSVEHVDARWGELANLVAEIWGLREGLKTCWDAP